MESAILDANTDGSTVTQAASGDEVAFARLIDEHHEPMVRAAYVVVGDVQLAREAAQNAWAIAWKRLPSLREPDRIRSWLVAISANEARQSVRRDKRRQIVEISDAPPDPVAGDPADSIDIVDLERALGKLEPDDRGLLAMRYAAGLDSTDIAAQLGMSASGVRSRLSRLVDRLRKDLDDA
jgi:RNA polymerase sigma-70 factor (ECF subfamily)